MAMGTGRQVPWLLLDNIYSKWMKYSWRKIKKAKSWRSVLAYVKGKMFQQLESGDASFSSSSKAWSFAVDSLAECVVPNSLCLTKIDGIASFGPWFTAGHIETGGDDSITHVPIGRKFMLIAERGLVSRVLEGGMNSIDALIRNSRSDYTKPCVGWQRGQSELASRQLNLGWLIPRYGLRMQSALSKQGCSGL